MGKLLILELKYAKIKLVRCIENIMTQHGLPASVIILMLENVLASLKDIERKDIEKAEAQVNSESAKKESEEVKEE